MVSHKEIGENQDQGGAHGYAMHLIVESSLKQEVSFFGSKFKECC